jgi:hypothetical protein
MLAGGVFILALGSTGVAVPFTDIITYGSPGTLVTHGSSLNDTFDITTMGFVPGTDIASSATAIFDLANDPLNGNHHNFSITINLGTGAVVSSGGLQNYTFTLGTGALADLNVDGRLGFQISQGNSSTDFYVTSAELDVGTVARGSPTGDPPAVPEGGDTATLVGFGLLAISAVARKLRATT